MLLFPRKWSSFGAERTDMNFEEYEIRPGGMLIQKRNSDSNQTSLTVPTIKVRVKYGSTNHEVHINSTASFGNGKFCNFLVSFLRFNGDQMWSFECFMWQVN